ncbi:prolyl oligopeptidase family serine peptidase [Nesterenkonia alba]|uniref:prolyl oligopeptidase family serine peptidase n=1 Tax=Nesterenkonia alba TaxID=515814 RepID=UPI00042A5F4F|nr:prolyl oligopeptidase family serine peptidase [Nesterenkonia alba]
MTTPKNPVIPSETEDPHLWLEEVTGQAALGWVAEQNERTERELQDGLFDEIKSELQTVLEATDRIPMVTKKGDYLYNLWTDAEHPQGLWRRTTFDSYRSEEPEWDVLLDLDALSEQEGITWVWHGADFLRPPEGEPHTRVLVNLSPGGSDADVTREFDLTTRQFIPEEDGGFYKPEGKGGLNWIDADTVTLSHDFGEDEVTTSGYSRVGYIWKRGTPLTEATPVVSVGADDMAARLRFDDTPGYERLVAVKSTGFYSHEVYVVNPEAAEGAAPQLTPVPVPDDARPGFHQDLILINPRTDFELGGTTYTAGSLLVADAQKLLAGATGDEAGVEVLFEPTSTTSLQGITTTQNTLVLTVMEDVQYKVQAHWRADGTWKSAPVFTEITGTISVAGVDDEDSDQVWITAHDFLNPTTLYLGDVSGVLTGGAATTEALKSLPERFDASGLVAAQRFTTSDDGTRVPYFIVGPADVVDPSPGAEVTPRPTLLYGYGGFQISQTPAYSAVIGKAWLQRGGVYVVANIRGGGEYGPQWHYSALRDNRHRAYEDFSSVAKDLVKTGVTTVGQLACRGGSNGGLLTGNMLTQYPDVFGAVVIQVPLLDMYRFHKLLAGASWRAEFGDPDTEDWEYMKSFSPYHLLDRDTEYPSVLLTTSTRDDRVHPGHARKMTAALESIRADVRYWENTEGGHGGAANPEQQAIMNGLIYRYLWKTLAGK